MTEQLPLSLPKDRKEIDALQRRQKVKAVENAKKSAYWKDALAGLDMNKLDDPEEWQKIPILEKDALRQMTAEEFYTDFCIAKGPEICEYWRSGGSPGKPPDIAATHGPAMMRGPAWNRLVCGGIS